MDKLIAHFILTKLLLILWLLVTLPIWLLAIWLTKTAAAHGQQNILTWGIRLASILLFLGLYWLSKRMSSHMTFGGLRFAKGVEAGFQDARLHLAFLPIVGRWFMESSDEPEDDDRR